MFLRVKFYDSPDTTGAAYYYLKKNADRAAGENRIACVKVEIDCEEGEGL